MFILSEDTHGVGSQVELEEMNLVGDAEELSSMGVELAESYSMLQMGVARLEAKAIREQAGEGVLSESTEVMLTEGVKEFFNKALEMIKKYWAKLVSYVKGAIERLKAFFTNQEKFIRTNREAISALTDADLKDVTFKRSYVIADPAVMDTLDKLDGYAKEQIAKIETSGAAKVKPENFQKAAIKAAGITGDAAKADSTSAAIKAAIVGIKDKEAVMTKKDIDNAQQVLVTASGVTKSLASAQNSAKTLIKIAESRAKMGMGTNSKGAETTKSEEIKKTLDNIKVLSPRVGGLYSASVSAAASAGSSAKTVIAKGLAAKASAKKSKKKAKKNGV